MSLVNEALKKARLEAARGQAANRGIPYPSLGTGDRSPSHVWIAAMVLTVILATVGGFFLYRAGKRSALEQRLAAHGGRPGTELSSAANVATISARAEPANDLAQNRPKAPRPGEEPPLGTELTSTGSSIAESTGDVAARPTRRPQEPPASRTVTGPAPASDRPAVAETTPKPATDPPRETPVARPESPTTTRSEAAPIETETSESAPSVAERVFVRRAEIPGVGPVELGGIAWSGDRPFALINGRVVRPGDSVAGLTVGTIEPNRVSLRGDAGMLIFKLK